MSEKTRQMAYLAHMSGSAFMLERTRKHDLEGNGLPNRTGIVLTHFLLLQTFSPLKHVYQEFFLLYHV